MITTGEGITLAQLMSAFPNEFSDIPNNEKTRQRLNIESIYREALKKEIEQFEQIKKEESLKIPSKIDYNA